MTSTKGPDVAATEAPPPNDARQRKQQQQQQPDYRYEERERNDTRYEGLVSICAAKSRELGRPFDESDARQRLTVHDLQRLADEIQHEIAIVDADSDTRRMKEDEQATENAQALADAAGSGAQEGGGRRAGGHQSEGCEGGGRSPADKAALRGYARDRPASQEEIPGGEVVTITEIRMGHVLHLAPIIETEQFYCQTQIAPKSCTTP